MISLRAPADDVGCAAVTAATRLAVERLGGDGDGSALVMRLLLDDARERLGTGVEDDRVSVDLEVDGTEIELVLRDRGTPVDHEPASLQPLIALGIVTGSSAGTDGAGNVTRVRIALEAHHRIVDAADLTHLPEDSAESADDVALRPLEAGDARELTHLIYRCYGWTYPHTALYFPDRIAAEISTGQRIGEVAVTRTGEIAAHWGAVRHGPLVAETGATVTDPRYRHRGLAAALGARLLTRLEDSGVIGRFREPVLTHTATQEIALREGATMVGLRVGRGHPIRQIGIVEGMTPTRTSVTVAYSTLQPLAAAPVWIPAPYEPILRTVLVSSGWARTLASPDGGRTPPAHVPTASIAETQFEAENRSAVIDIRSVGRDLVDVIDAGLDRAQRSGAQYAEVHLPTDQPATALLGAGLIDLGLAYAAWLPLLRDGTDILVLQWHADPDVDTSAWRYADERVEALALAVVAQVREAAQRAVDVRRSAAREAR